MPNQFSFEYFPPSSRRRQQSFEYAYRGTRDYAFEYDRLVQKDTSQYNPLVPVNRTRTRVFYWDRLTSYDKLPSELEYFEPELHALKDNMYIWHNDLIESTQDDNIANVIGSLMNWRDSRRASLFADEILKQVYKDRYKINLIITNALFNEKKYDFYNAPFYAKLDRKSITPKDIISIYKVLSNKTEPDNDYFDSIFRSRLGLYLYNTDKALAIDLHLNIFLDNYSLSQDNHFNIYDDSYALFRDKLLNILDIKTLIPHENILNVYENNHSFKRQRTKSNVDDEQFQLHKINIANLFVNKLVSFSMPKTLNILKDSIQLHRKKYGFDKSHLYSLDLPNKILNRYELGCLIYPTRVLNEFMVTYLKRTVESDMAINTQQPVHRTIRNSTNINESYDDVFKKLFDSDVYRDYSSYIKSIIGNTNLIDFIWLNKEKYEAFNQDIINVNRLSSYDSETSEVIGLHNSSKYAFTTNSETLQNSQKHGFMTQANTLWRNHVKAQETATTFVKRKNRNAFITDITKLIRNTLKASIANIFAPAKRTNGNIYTQEDIRVTRGEIIASTLEYRVSLIKTILHISPEITESFAERKDRQFDIIDSGYQALFTGRNFDIQNTGLFTKIKQRDMNIDKFSTQVKRTDYDINFLQSDLWSKKFNQDLKIYEYGVFNSRTKQGLIIDLDTFLIKNIIDISIVKKMNTQDTIHLIKNKQNLQIDIFYSFGRRKGYYGNYDIHSSFLDKSPYDTMTVEEILSSKLVIDNAFYLPDVMGITKSASHAFLDYQNEMLKKSVYNSIIKENQMTLSKAAKKAWLYEDESVDDYTGMIIVDDKKQKDTSLFDNLYTFSKGSKGGWSDFFDVTFDKKYKDVNLANILSPAEKPNYGWNYNITDTTFETDKYSIEIHGAVNYILNRTGFQYHESAIPTYVNNRRGLNELESDEPIYRESVEFSIADNMLSGNRILNSLDVYAVDINVGKIGGGIDILKTINSFDKLCKSMNIDDDNVDNWVWVYEHPDPFERPLYIGLDELLIPERDTRYKDFEDLIFDKETMTPRNPIKVVDDHTWIAKYPIKHPTPTLEEVGIEYIDVEAGLMKDIFLEFYRVWNKNVFKFGGMDMAQSVSLMLNYLYDWIVLYMPERFMKQALRTLRLIRWFGETSIIRNSQYLISYDYGDLKSNLHTGKCDIQHSALNMVINKKEGVFESTLINHDAYVEFEVDNRLETTISFSIITMIGTVFIYLNDVLIDSVVRTAHNLTYVVPYTGEINRIKIIKPTAHNKTKDFYIGYIIVKNCAIDGLEIKYDPSLKAGNKPLDEMAQKMIAYANLYEDNAKIFEDLYKGNLGVSETYKQLLNYWNLHHENKEKGKRLTIKQV